MSRRDGQEERTRRRPARHRAAGGRALVAVLLAACWLLSPSAAHADTATLTRFFDDQARTAFAARRYQLALEYFLLVDRATPSPSAAYNVAVLADTAGEQALAFAYLERYLASDDEDEARRADATRRAQALRAELALVRIDSDPPGARIYVDQVEHGAFGRSPRTIVVAPGAHRILLHAPRHRPAEVEVTAAVGQEATARAALVPLTGELLVRATPPGTPIEVRRQGALVRRIPAATSTELPVGRYELRIAPAGHHPAEAIAVVDEGEQQLTLVARRLPPRTGTLLVTTGAVTADLYVDGKLTAETPATLRQVPVGEHTIELRAPGHRTATSTVRIVEGRPAFVELDLLRLREPRP